MDLRAHWDSIYAGKSDAEVSWTQIAPTPSIDLIREATPHGAVIDIGGGTSLLAGALLDAGYDVAVLDLSEEAIRHSRERLGERGGRVRWIVGDVTTLDEIGAIDVWHDRAVFHFLTDGSQRERYVDLCGKTVLPGGHLVIGTFALDGPEKCSGLAVERYDAARLAKSFGAKFRLLRECRHEHITPWGKPQRFQFAVLQRVANGAA